MQDVECDFEEHHFGLFREAPGDATTLIGGLTGRPDATGPDGKKVVRLRQVVVHDEWRNRGHGSIMLREAERLLAGLGYARLMLYARGEAVEFYERNGYQATGEKAYLIGLEHLRLEKAAPGV